MAEQVFEPGWLLRDLRAAEIELEEFDEARKRARKRIRKEQENPARATDDKGGRG